MENVIVSADPGQDDAVAILLAAKRCRVLGLVTVYGNSNIENVTKNTLNLLDFSGHGDIRVAKGSPSPLINEIPSTSPIHGHQGLRGMDLPESNLALLPYSGAESIIKLTKKENEPVTLISLGPLTTIATALMVEPEISDNIKEISLMGGSVSFGNIGPVTELNIGADPEAAHIVFSSGIPIRMCGLNLTRKVDVTSSTIDDLRESKGKVASSVSMLLEYREKKLKETFGFSHNSLHDPCAVFAITNPEIFSFESLPVQIELQGEYTRGMTVCDKRPGDKTGRGSLFKDKKKTNVSVAFEIELDEFNRLLRNTIMEYN